MKNLVLIGENKDLVVECLNDEFEFVHNTMDSSNWFNQKTLAKIFGVSVDNISKRLNQYLNRFNKINSNSTKSRKAIIKLKTNDSTQRVKFYDFKAVTYLAYRINTVEAMNMLEWIDSSLNTMFNVATGKTELDTKMDKLKNLYEVEEFKANEYLQSYKHLIKFDEELANKSYQKYKISKANAFNCHELLMDKRAWHNRADEVINTIEPRTGGSEQLKLI